MHTTFVSHLNNHLQTLIHDPPTPPSVALRSGEALLAALGANTSLISLFLCDVQAGGVAAAAAFAASLRRNATLRNVDLSGSGLGGPEGMRLVLAALGGSSSETPSLCALTRLDISQQLLDAPACAALGESLGRGIPLEELRMTECAAGDAGAALIAQGIRAAGPRSRLRFLDMSRNQITSRGAHHGQPCPLPSFSCSATKRLTCCRVGSVNDTQSQLPYHRGASLSLRSSLAPSYSLPVGA